MRLKLTMITIGFCFNREQISEQVLAKFLTMKNPKFICYKLNKLYVLFLSGMCEWVLDSRASAWPANPCELRIRITDVPCPHHVGRAYGGATSHNIKKGCEWVSDSRESAWLANPCELRIRITALNPQRVVENAPVREHKRSCQNLVYEDILLRVPDR